MADARLLVGREFGEGLAQGGEEKQGIVAKAARTSLRMEKDSPGFAAKAGERSAVLRGHDYAHELGLALFFRHRLQLGQQARVIGRVAGVLLWRSRGIAGRVHARRALQRLRAVSLNAQQARLLHVNVGSAGLNIERRSFLDDGRVVEFTTSWYRGDIYDFVAELQTD